ncbi:helix-turn-helix domain-containing protein [Paenibacillaceae bacterium]|nr:helix-turn-helix domain-containing protein [Paenibacillaceae bacterium]
MNLDDHIAAWDDAVIKILDIRHVIVHPGELLAAYLLPASGFIYSVRGSADLSLDGMIYEARQFHIAHVGKGMRLSIDALEEFEYFLLFYRADLSRLQSGRRERTRLPDRQNPFLFPYNFLPNEPLPLRRIVSRMKNIWVYSSKLERLQIKGLFYQFLHELMGQLKLQGIVASKPEVVSRTLRYLHDHYRENVTLDALAEIMNYSPRHLSTKFKEQTGASPIDYLIRLRLDYAKELLLDTNASLRDIAIEVGYTDVYYFSRVFKKHIGLSPAHFKNVERQRHASEDRPCNPAECSIGARRIARYIGDDNHYQYKSGGSVKMIRNTKSSMALTILLSLTLLLGACSAGAGNTTAGGNSAGGNTGTSTTATGSGDAGATGSNGGSAVGNQQAASSDNAGAQTQTRTVATMFGDIEVPQQPKRIIVDLYLGSMIALGITPVGTPELNLKNPYYTEFLGGVEDIGEYETISLEKVLALEPDLIITGNDQLYEQFSKIAPTIVVPFGELKNAHEEITYFGKALGREVDAKKWLDDYDQRIASARESVAEVIADDAVFSIMQYNKKGVLVFGDNFGRGGQAVYTALGLQPPAAKKEELMTEQLLEVSEEALPEYVGDYIIMTTEEVTLEGLKNDPVWSTLDPVKNDRVFTWSSDHSWYFDPIATLSQTEEIAAWLTGKSTKQ